VIGLIICVLPSPKPFVFAGNTVLLSPEAQKAIALLAVFVSIFITEALPFGITVALVYAWIVIFGIMPKEAAAGAFSHDAAWFLVGALMISSVLVRHNLHRRVLALIMGVTGHSVRRILLGMVGFCALSSMFIAGHTIAALMLPVGLALVEDSGGFRKVPNLAKLTMFCIAFGCSIGGLATPSGGGRNVVMIGYLNEFFGISMGYGQWMIMAAPITLILIPCVVLILFATFKPEVRTLGDLSGRLKMEMATRPMTHKEWSVICVFVLVVALWITQSHLGIGMIAMLGALIYLVLGLADWADYQRINWSVALLYFAALGLGRGLIESGAATWLAAKGLLLIDSLGITGGYPMVGVSSLLMSLLTQTMGAGPCVAAFGPVLLEAARITSTNPVVAGVAVAIASSFAFSLIVGTPPNAIVYGSGFLRAKDFLKVGTILAVVSILVLLVVVRVLWIGLGIMGS
jgi:sodium-dependent dicarboxylate transporter 2/3/5